MFKVQKKTNSSHLDLKKHDARNSRRAERHDDKTQNNRPNTIVLCCNSNPATPYTLLTVKESVRQPKTTVVEEMLKKASFEIC